MTISPTIETIGVLDIPDVIHIGYELIDYMARDIVRSTPDVTNYVAVTDTNIAPLYLDRLMSGIQSHEKQILKFVIMPGEQSKSRDMAEAMEDYMFESSCTRDTCLIALGGGVIGDLVGFVASTFMGGIPYIQIPTTLLAMVDSSIGGKTAINTPQGKDLIGTFWQPKRIYIDPSLLKTLPKREFSNGMVEVIKTTAISSESNFMKLETGKKKLESFFDDDSVDRDPVQEVECQALLVSLISAAVRFKVDNITKDEKESGSHGLLNFGHTFGHAYERILSPDWRHGDCISLGLLHEAKLSHALGHCSCKTLERLENCLNLYSLPTEFSENEREKLTVNAVLQIMKVGEKNVGSQKRMVLLKNIGEPVEQKASAVPDDSIIQLLSKYIPNDIAPTPSPIEKKRRLPINVTLVASEPPLIDLVVNISQAVSNKYILDEIRSQNHIIKCVSAYNDKVIRVFISYKPGSNTSNSKRRPEYEYIVFPDTATENIIAGVLQFLENLIHTSRRHVKTHPNKGSAFISLTLKEFGNVLPQAFNRWVEGADAVELRVDLLTPPSDETSDWIITAGTQLFYLRQLTNLPIIFTVRTIPQAGHFDPCLEQTYYKLIEWAHRWGCEYIDVELTTLPSEKLDKLMQFSQFYISQWIASFHDPEHMTPWTSRMMSRRYAQARELFTKHDHKGIVKLVGFAESFQDNLELEHFRYQIDPLHIKPIIFINMGPKGKLSRVANRFLTPATHPDLPFSAVPGQLSVKQLKRIREELDMNY